MIGKTGGKAEIEHVLPRVQPYIDAKKIPYLVSNSELSSNYKEWWVSFTAPCSRRTWDNVFLNFSKPSHFCVPA